jgi:hypothetical protein
VGQRLVPGGAGRVEPGRPDTVEVTISNDYSGACTADISPTTSVLDLPDTITAQADLNVRIRGAPIPCGRFARCG